MQLNASAGAAVGGLNEARWDGQGPAATQRHAAVTLMPSRPAHAGWQREAELRRVQGAPAADGQAWRHEACKRAGEPGALRSPDLSSSPHEAGGSQYMQGRPQPRQLASSPLPAGARSPSAPPRSRWRPPCWRTTTMTCLACMRISMPNLTQWTLLLPLHLNHLPRQSFSSSRAGQECSRQSPCGPVTRLAVPRSHRCLLRAVTAYLQRL